MFYLQNRDLYNFYLNYQNFELILKNQKLCIVEKIPQIKKF